jgi:hypothetical protein
LTPRASRERVALRIAVTDDSQTQGSGKFMSPIKAGVILAALAVLTAALIASPVAANAAPKPGVYHGVVKNTPAPGGHNEGEGYVRLKKTTNGLRIVAPGNFTCPGGPCSVQYITAPSWFGDTTYKTCNNTRNAAYATGTSIPVKAGSFDYTGRSAFDTNRKIRIAGTWATSTTITGYTRFTTTGGCVSQKLPWKMSWIAN